MSPVIYAAQRKASKEPILVFNNEGMSPSNFNNYSLTPSTGKLTNEFGSDTITAIDGEYGVFGICLFFSVEATYLLVADSYDHTLKQYTTTGELVATIGMKLTPQPDIYYAILNCRWRLFLL